MQSIKDKILKSGKSILSILLAVLLINQGIVAEAASGAQTATPNEKTASAEAQKPQSFTLNAVKQTIGVKGTCKISVKKARPQNADKSVSYQSKNTKIATVNSKGVVTGKKLGKTKIVVTAMQNKKLKKYVTIEVKNLKPTKLTLNAKNVKIKYGDKYQLIAKVRPQNMYCPVVFSSNNKKVATIDKNGVIRGKKAGTATITARTKYKNKKGKYLYKKCTVKVSHNYKLVKSVNPTCEKLAIKNINATAVTKHPQRN